MQGVKCLWAWAPSTNSAFNTAEMLFWPSNVTVQGIQVEIFLEGLETRHHKLLEAKAVGNMGRPELQVSINLVNPEP